MLEKPFIGNLSGGLASALVDIEPRYRADAISAGAQRLERLGQTETERAQNSGRDNGDPRVFDFYVWSVRYRHFQRVLASICYCFLSQSILLKRPERGKQQLGSWWIVS